MIRWEPSTTYFLPQYMKGINDGSQHRKWNACRGTEGSRSRHSQLCSIGCMAAYIYFPTGNKHFFMNRPRISLGSYYWICLCLRVCSGRIILIRICKKQSGSPLVICQRSRNTWRMGKLAVVIAYRHCNPCWWWTFPFLLTSSRNLTSHPTSMTWHVPYFDYEVIPDVIR